MQTVRRLAIGLLLGLLGVGSLHAAREPVECRIDVGFAGVAGPPGTLVPVTVILRNRVAGTRGEIEVTQPDSAGLFEARHVLPFETPLHSTKRFTLLVRSEDRGELHITVRFAEHLDPVFQIATLERTTKRLVLGVGVPGFYVQSAHLGTDYRGASIRPEETPVDPLAYDAVHAVIVGRGAFAALSAEQVDALRRWVRTGGTLVFVDPATTDVGFARNLALLAGRGTLDPGARGVRAFGLGLVASSGPDGPTEAPFWRDRPGLAAILFPVMPEQDRQFPYRSEQGHFTQLWKTQRTHGVMAVVWIVLIIGAYIAVTVPFDYWVCRKTRTPHMTWAILSVAIVAFSCLAAGYGSLVNVGTMRTVSVAVLDADPASGTARGTALGWLYSPRNAVHNLDAGRENACLSMLDEADSTARYVTRATILNGRNSTVSARIPVFAARQFMASWYEPWPHTLTATTNGSECRVDLPPHCQVRTAWLAGPQGLMPLVSVPRPGGVTLRSAGRWAYWTDALPNRVNTLQGHDNYGGFNGQSDSSLLPSPERLENYLLCVSCPWIFSDKPIQGFNSNPWWVQNFRRQRSWRECRLDALSRLTANPPSLLLFVEMGREAAPFRVRGRRPDTAELALIRMRLPEGETPSLSATPSASHGLIQLEGGNPLPPQRQERN